MFLTFVLRRTDRQVIIQHRYREMKRARITAGRMLLCITFFLVAAQAALGQEASVSFGKLSVRDGLSNSSVYSLFQDSQGFIWIGTADGLNRYDGYNFTVFDSQLDPPYRIPGEMITSIDMDRNGNLWFGVQFGGLLRLDKTSGTFTSYLINPVNPQDAANDVWVVKTDFQNRVWTGTTENGLYLFDPATGIFTPVLNSELLKRPEGCNTIRSVITDHNNDIRVATGDEGLYIIDKYSLAIKRFDPFISPEEHLRPKKINSIFEDSHQRFWIGTREDGLYILQRDGRMREHLSPANRPEMASSNIRCFLENDDGTIWIGTDGDGAYLYHPEKKTFIKNSHRPDDPESLSSNVVFSLLRSRDGVIWAGTNKGGLNLYDYKRERFGNPADYELPVNRNLNYKVLISLFEDQEGNIWFGTDGGGLNCYNRSSGQLKIYRNNPEDRHSISGNAVKVLFQDRAGRLWAGTYGNGLNRYLPKQDEFIQVGVEGEPVAHDIWDISEDPEGNLWIATLNEGLFIIRKDKEIMVPFNEGQYEGQIGDHLFCLLWDKKKNGLWIGTSRGLKFLDPSGEKITSWPYNRKDSVSTSGSEIKTLFLDSTGALWVGTRRGGLNRIDPESGLIKHYTTENGLISNTIASVEEDQNGRIWVSTNTGISVYDQNTGNWSGFNVDDGLRNSEFLSESSCRLSNGSFIFGGSNGYDYINPERIRLNTYVPEVQIARILINDNEVYPFRTDKKDPGYGISDQLIVLRHDQRSISIRLTALAFTHPENNRYAYRLLGYNESWTDMGNQRLLTFSDLRPKTYELQLKAANNDGLWNDQVRKVSIQVLPPWWSTLLFRIIMAALIFSLLLLIALWRIRFVRNQKLRLERLVEERTRELEGEKKKTEEQNRVLMDIQKQIMQQNEEISRQKEDIEKMSEEARRSDQEKLVFFTNISHEIRTPLSLIIGPMEELVNDYSLGKQVRNQLSLTYRNALSLLNLVNQILDFRRIESNNYPFSPVNTVAVTLLQEVFVSFTQKAVNQQITYSFHSTGEHILGMFDTGKLDKIVFNLLSNAFKFTAAGGTITLNCSARQGEEGSGQELLIVEVKDSGQGIAPEFHDKIFERFFQIQDERMYQREGTGIGLSLVRSLVDLMNGRIELESSPGKGTLFRITLPYTHTGPAVAGRNELHEFIVAAPEKALSEDHDPVPVRNTNGKDRPRILVCEDHHELLDFIATQLHDHYRVVTCDNGETARELVRKIIPDLVLSDIMMPGLNGIDLCRIIKQNIETSHIPVILLTARSGVEYKLEGLDAGADDYIYKPFRIDELRKRIENLIHSRRVLRKKFSTGNRYDPEELTITSTDEKFLSRAIAVVEKEMASSSFNVTEFVREMHMSRTLIHTKLRELTDTSASGFIRILRLKKAALLLSKRSYSVSEVAYMVGFSDPKYFHKCFREHFGTTPGEFMEQPGL